MTTETKRDLAADLALCEAATPGPWFVGGGPANEIRQPNGSRRRRITTPPDADGIKDASFIAQAREGWPHVIRRAIEAEAEVAKLRAELKAESLRAAEWEGEALGYEEENAKLREVIEDFVDHVREVTALIRPNETEFSCDYRRVWSLSRLTEIYSEVPDDAAETDE